MKKYTEIHDRLRMEQADEAGRMGQRTYEKGWVDALKWVLLNDIKSSSDVYLYIEMFDGWTAYNELQCGCSHPTGCKRIVKVKLTDDQINLLKPKKTGNNGKMDMFESVNPICIQVG